MISMPARNLLSHTFCRVAMAVLIVLGVAAPSCSGGGGGGGGVALTSTSSTSTSATSPSSSTASSQTASNSSATATPAPSGTSNLSENDVNTIVLQAVNQATALHAPATIAVVDRVGNVLAVTQMSGAPANATVTSNRGVTGGLEGTAVPSTLAAISKALTGAYLSSNGNAFSTRTANQIIQEHFNPGVAGTPSGPLFGVQFSQLSCSDFNTVAAATPGATNAGPHRSPLGFAADSGGLPIYKNGVLQGGIGVMSTAIYSLNLDVFNVPIDNNEVIAIAGVTGFEAPPGIQAPTIAVGGLTLQYTDASAANFAAPVSGAGSFTPLPVNAVSPGYFPGPAPGHTAIAGTTYGTQASGIVPDGTIPPTLYPGVNAFVFTNGQGNVLFQPTNGLAPPGVAITASEAQQLMTSALAIAVETRAAIRNPLNSFAQVNVTIVDLDGNVLAQARTPDAPVFGADVSRQKARTAVFFSRPDAAATINAITIPASTDTGTFADYITRSQQLVDPTVFADGFAWSEVAIGDISRPFYPDGIDGKPPGSLSLPFATHWSIFSTGFQTDLIRNDIVAGAGGAPPPAAGCANNGGSGELPIVLGGKTQLADGVQIFSGGVPIYRGNVLVGGIGVSGDGIQQDSLVAFLGVQDGPATLNNAPAAIRADQLSAGGVHLRYIHCPPSPFLNSTVQNAC
jgi:uncharacterized protein GlcG (DUF336 family)